MDEEYTKIINQINFIFFLENLVKKELILKTNINKFFINLLLFKNFLNLPIFPNELITIITVMSLT